MSREAERRYELDPGGGGPGRLFVADEMTRKPSFAKT